MALTGYIKSLFSDKEKTSPLFPITKTKAVIDDEGKNLDELLGDAIFVDDGSDEATGYVNADTLGGKAEGQLSVANAAALGGKAPEYYVQPRNLLDNSDFRNPVNQRGNTTITTDKNYIIDRWLCRLSDGATVSVSESGIVIYNNSDVDVNVMETIVVKDSTYTFAAKTTDEIWYRTFTIKDGVQTTHNAHTGNTGALPIYISGNELTCYLQIKAGQTETFEWAALYEGEYTTETLPPYIPKGYGAELAECQRYYQQSFTGTNKKTTANSEIKFGANTNWIENVNFVLPMRSVPTVTIYDCVTGNANAVCIWSDDSLVSDVTAGRIGTGGFMPVKSGGLVKNESYAFHYTASADL